MTTKLWTMTRNRQMKCMLSNEYYSIFYILLDIALTSIYHIHVSRRRIQVSLIDTYVQFRTSKWRKEMSINNFFKTPRPLRYSNDNTLMNRVDRSFSNTAEIGSLLSIIGDTGGQCCSWLLGNYILVYLILSHRAIFTEPGNIYFEKAAIRGLYNGLVKYGFMPKWGLCSYKKRKLYLQPRLLIYIFCIIYNTLGLENVPLSPYPKRMKRILWQTHTFTQWYSMCIKFNKKVMKSLNYVSADLRPCFIIID